MENVNEVRHGLSPILGDGIANRPFRLNRHSELIAEVFGPDRAAAEGSRFVSINPTLGTAIATTTSITGFDATKPVMLVQNRNGVGGANIILDYLRLILAQVPTSATAWNWAMVVDTINRYTSGGSAITPTNVNTGGAGSGAGIYFGAVVAPAAGAAVKTVHRSQGRSVIPVTLDEWVFKFGAAPDSGAGSLGGAVALRMPIPCGPVVLRPGDSWLLYGWGASNAAAPSWEFELGHTER